MGPTGNGFYPSTEVGCHWGTTRVNGNGYQPYYWEECESGEYIQSIEYAHFYAGDLWYLRTWCCPLSTTHKAKRYQRLGDGWGRPPASQCNRDAKDCRVNGFWKQPGKLGMWVQNCRQKCTETNDCLGFSHARQDTSSPGLCFIYTSGTTDGGQDWKAFPQTYKSLGTTSSKDKVETWVVSDSAYFGPNDYKLLGDGFCNSNSCNEKLGCSVKGMGSHGHSFDSCYKLCDAKASCLGFAYGPKGHRYSQKCVLYGDICDTSGGEPMYGEVASVDKASGESDVKCWKKPNVEPTSTTSTCGGDAPKEEEAHNPTTPETDNPMKDLEEHPKKGPNCDILSSGTNGKWWKSSNDNSGKKLSEKVTEEECQGLCYEQTGSGVCAYKAAYKQCWFNQGAIITDYKGRYGWSDPDHNAASCGKCSDADGFVGFNLDMADKYYGGGLSSVKGKANTCGQECKDRDGCWGFVTYGSDCYVQTEDATIYQEQSLSGAKTYTRCWTDNQMTEESLGFRLDSTSESLTLTVIPEEHIVSPVVSVLALVGVAATINGFYGLAIKGTGNADNVDIEL